MHGLSIYFVMGNSARCFLDLHLNADSSSRQRFTPCCDWLMRHRPDRVCLAASPTRLRDRTRGPWRQGGSGQRRSDGQPPGCPWALKAPLARTTSAVPALGADLTCPRPDPTIDEIMRRFMAYSAVARPFGTLPTLAQRTRGAHR